MTKYKILCAFLATALAVSLSRDRQLRDVLRNRSNRIRRRAQALANALSRDLEPPNQPKTGALA